MMKILALLLVTLALLSTVRAEPEPQYGDDQGFYGDDSDLYDDDDADSSVYNNNEDADSNFYGDDDPEDFRPGRRRRRCRCALRRRFSPSGEGDCTRGFSGDQWCYVRIWVNGRRINPRQACYDAVASVVYPGRYWTRIPCRRRFGGGSGFRPGNTGDSEVRDDI